MSNSLFRLAVDAPFDGGPGRYLDGRRGSSTSGERTDPSQPGLPGDQAATGREQDPTHPGPAIGPSFGFCPISSHRTMRWLFARPSTARRPTRASFACRVGDGPDLRSCSLHSLNRKARTYFEPVSGRLAPIRPLLWSVRRWMRPDFLCAGLFAGFAPVWWIDLIERPGRHRSDARPLRSPCESPHRPPAAR
jgi:hypothetical protein